MKKQYIAIDLGASNGRGILGTVEDGKLTLTEVHRFENNPVMVGEHLCWNVLGLLENIKTALRMAAQRLDGQTVDGIGIDTWGVDFGILDANGEILGIPIHYRDDQTDGMMEEAAQTLSQAALYQETGIAFMKFNTLYQLLAMKKRRSVALEHGARLLFMPDLMGWLLTGQMATEYTIASTGAVLSAKTRDWSDKLFDVYGLPKGLRCPVVQPGTMLGRLRPAIAQETGLGEAPVYSVAGHDTASAVAAVPAQGGDFAYLSSGTWSLMGIESPVPMLGEEMIRGNFTNEGGAFGTYRILKNIMGLWIVQECRRYWIKQGQDYSFGRLVELAEAEPPFLAMIDPDDELFFDPGRMPEKVQEFCRKTGQSVPETPGAIIRCVLESLALRYRWCVDALEKIRGSRIEALHIVGGGCQNALLNQFTANALGRPVICGPVEATAIGNIIMQAVGDGAIASLEEGRRLSAASFDLDCYQGQDAAAWQEAYAAFCQRFGA